MSDKNKLKDFKTQMILLTCLGAFCLLMAYSEDGFGDGYVSAATTHIDTPYSSHKGVTLTGGYRFNGVLSFEGRGLAWNTDKSHWYYDARLRSLWGFYFKGTLPLGPNLGVYALYGHSRSSQKITHMGVSSNIDDSGTSVGFGARYTVAQWTVYGEFMEVLDDTEQMSVGLELLFYPLALQLKATDNSALLGALRSDNYEANRKLYADRVELWR